MIQKVKNKEHSQLLSVWESSVKATHHFLGTEDFEFYKNLIPDFFSKVNLHCLKNDTGQIIGFIGTNDENLEMLFVSSNEIGKGIGKKLLLFAIKELGITKVDVNQDNLQATNFYLHFGFKLQAVSDFDGFGKPYPILHLALTTAM